jgi:hypothetical protein
MVIVGGGAALTAIAVYFAIIGAKSLRASWRARKAARKDGPEALPSGEAHAGDLSR